MANSDNYESVRDKLQQALSACQRVGELVGVLGEVFAQHDLFYGHGTENPQDEAYALIFSVLELSFEETDAVWEQPFDSSCLDSIIHIASRRICERIPLPYLTGEAWFAGLPFKIDPRALIPRSPFAELIHQQFTPWLEDATSIHVLDMCTGNGCIGIATAVHLPQAKVDLVDLSDDALQLARDNIHWHGVADRVTAIQSDIFDAVPKEKYDLIISNPPYVPASSMEQLPVEYSHEPVMALQADDEGMAIVDRILKESADYLTDNGVLIVEVGEIEEAVHLRYSDLPFIWLEFEQGGEGVFLLHKKDLDGME